MDTKTNVEPTATDRNLAIRRARTRLLLGPALEAARGYRSEIVSNLDRTIDRLERLAVWVEGGEMPPDLTQLGETMRRAFCEADKAAREELNREHLGEVLFCEVAEQVLLLESAMGDTGGASVNDHAARLVGAMNKSLPNEETGGDAIHAIANGLMNELEENGVFVPDIHAEPTSRANRDFEKDFPRLYPEQAGHA